MHTDKGGLIRAGCMVRVAGVSGFGFVKELIWCVNSQKCVLSVLVTVLGSDKQDELMLLDTSDCSLYHSEKSTAKKVYASPQEHEFYALEMAA